MKLLKIALVDDKQDDINRLENFILKYEEFHKESVNFNIVKFNNGINFIDPFDDAFDAVFLDIDMPSISGLECAKKIREFNSKMVIIFVTNYASLAVDGYGVDALGFVVKPTKENDVFQVLDKLIKHAEEKDDEKKIIIKVKSGYQTIKPSDIKYIEVSIHDVFIYTTYGIFKTRGALKSIEKSFNKDKFVKCSSCFLVNLDFVDSVEKDDIKIDGKRIKIARNRKKEFLKAFLNNYQ